MASLPTSQASFTEESEEQPEKDHRQKQLQHRNFVQSTIESYLNNNLNAKDTASLLITPINEALDADNVDDDDIPDEGAIWNVILSITRQHPYNHPYILSLVNLLAAIQDSPDPASWKQHQQSWRHLPSFGMEVRENWNRTLSSSPSPQHQHPHWSCTPAEWTSMNALIAHLTVARVFNFNRYAIWALRDALEDEHGQTSLTGRVANLDHYVPAAA
ncbi:MAG: hypothetical protein Q9222_003348, partial [Ikaeria aurantiellina]